MHQLTLDRRDLEVIRAALAVGATRARGELTILRIAEDRDLESWERALLPPNLQDDSRADLADQIDPWISLVSHYEGLLRDIQTALDTEDR